MAVGPTAMKDARTLGVGRLGVSSSAAVLSPGERPRGSGDAAFWFSNIARKLRMTWLRQAKLSSASEGMNWMVVQRYGGCGRGLRVR
jgi:hypothetical protein